MVKFIIYFMKFLIAILVSIFFTSCRFDGDFNGVKGSGNVITETRTINESFRKIEVNSGISLVVEQSDNKSVLVEADDNIVSHVTTRVENGTLIIDTDSSFNTQKNPTVIVKLPIISGLKATSGSNIKTNNRLVTENIQVDINSGSSVDIEVEADFIALESTSGSSAEVSGIALKLETTATSGSEIDGDSLSANDVYADASSGSSISVDPIVSLNAHSSSGASITYKTTPKTLTKKESSGGSVSSHH